MEYTREQELLRQTFLKEAEEIVADFKKDPNILAVFLTGSAAWGIPNPDGDLDILLVTEKRKGVYYRYLIPKFCRVVRRTELGIIPREVVQKNIKRAYGDLLSSSTIEQFKNGRILFQKDDFGEQLIKACRDVTPGIFLIGKSINEIKKLLTNLLEKPENQEPGLAILIARRIMNMVTRLLLLVRDRRGVAKEKQEYRAVNKYFSVTERESYNKVMGIKNIDEEEAYTVVKKTITLLTGILLKRAISSKVVSYNEFHQPTA
ncbi:MAG: nucleotidyltransferase domain-containing protein [Candidatus Zixiibacteriota bacterium]